MRAALLTALASFLNGYPPDKAIQCLRGKNPCGPSWNRKESDYAEYVPYIPGSAEKGGLRLARQRERQILFRVSADEAERIEAKIRQAGLSKRQYLTDAALGSRIVVIEELKTMIIEMKRQGNNLNQIARKLNSGEKVSSQEFADTMSQVRQAWAELTFLIRAAEERLK